MISSPFQSNYNIQMRIISRFLIKIFRSPTYLSHISPKKFLFRNFNQKKTNLDGPFSCNWFSKDISIFYQLLLFPNKLFRFGEPYGYFRPVYNVPPFVHIACPIIFILQVISMFPYIKNKDWDRIPLGQNHVQFRLKYF